jgi:Domain of unknown function (DUF4034)
MSQKHFRMSFGISGLLGLLALALSTSSCAQTEASGSSAQPDAVMQSIRDYGRGHQTLLSPTTSAKPDQPNVPYSAHIRSVLFQEDFAQLEKIARQNRGEKGRLIGGAWKVVGFYNGTSAPGDEGVSPDSDWQLLLAKLQKWLAAYPDSATPRLSLAYFYVNYGWRARGSGLADTVEDSQWKVLNERNAKAKSILLEVATFKEKDPFWYQLMQLLARHEGWDKAQARELFDQAIAFEPSYYNYYTEHSRFLLPQWYGEPGEIRAFANETVSRVPEPDGSMLYFWIFSSEVCYCKEGIGALGQADYPKLRQGYANISKFYGLSNLNANRFAFMASVLVDKPSAHEAFASVVKMDEDIWGSEQNFEQFRMWANTP